MTKKPNQKTSSFETLGKEAIRQTAEPIHKYLTRVGGWAVSGSKKTIVDLTKKYIQEKTK